MTAKRRTYELTDVEADHLITCIIRAIDDGWYFGNRSRFDRRNERIAKELQQYRQPPHTPAESQS